MVSQVSHDELKTALDRGEQPVLVEALSQASFQQSHLPGAINIPLDTADAQVSALLPDKAAPVVTYCASPTCSNSGILASRLADLGYTNVRTYAEGKQGWAAAGLPLEAGAPPARVAP